jgi:hypothetical protein
MFPPSTKALGKRRYLTQDVNDLENESDDDDLIVSPVTTMPSTY